MSIVVQKFGGTSVASADRIRRAAERAVAATRTGHQVVMVVSARGKKTDELVQLAGEITDAPGPREMDMLLATGEQESAALMAMAVHELGEAAISLTGAQIGVLTDESHTRARIVRISTERIKNALDAGQIVIAAGFQGVDAKFNITTLGRGGSDTTATALAAVLNAERCDIYTDVEGVFTTDPRVVADATLIHQVSCDEMLELASMGAGVMHSRSIEFARKYGVPLRVSPSYADGSGTMITPEPSDCDRVVTGVAFVRNEARVGLTDLPDRPGVMDQIFSRLSAAGIPVDMVIQNVGQAHSASLSFTVAEVDLAAAVAVAREAVVELGAGSVAQFNQLSKVSVVGHGMQTQYGVAAQMFQILADNGINIEMVTTSEIKISVLIDRRVCDAAVNAVHDGFGLHQNIPLTPDANTRHSGYVGAEQRMTPRDEEIVEKLSGMEDIVVSDVVADTHQARVTVNGLPDDPGIAARVLRAVADGGVLVDMIVQNASDAGNATISITVPAADADKTTSLLQESLRETRTANISCEPQVGKLSVSGIGLRSHADVAARVFRILAHEHINVQLVNTSEIKVSILVTPDEARRGSEALRKEFNITS
ncbi:MAG: aspartate kinase [Fuerstiella sp.]|nr:aspartate kinase [Fuerstiella sp.]